MLNYVDTQLTAKTSSVLKQRYAVTYGKCDLFFLINALFRTNFRTFARKKNTHILHDMEYMSQEGYDKLVAELHQLEAVERPKASAAIAEARDKGDLSENSEYDAAKEHQAMVEIKITQLKATIGAAKIIDTSKLNAGTVQILSRVELRNPKNNATMAYTIVSETEANLREGKISVKTPIAQGLLGRKMGETVDIKVPQGTIQLEILNISFEE